MIGVIRVDAKQALRALIRDKSNIAAVLSIALAGGACTAVFSLFSSVLLNPLPYPDADRLTSVWQIDPKKPQDRRLVSPQVFEHWRDGAESFDSLAAYVSGPDIHFDLGTEKGAERIPGAVVSSNFFSTLGVQPRLGRIFNQAEQSPAGPLAALVSEPLWRRLGANPALDQVSIRLSGRRYHVVGVLSPELAFPVGVRVWVPRPQETHKALNLGLDIHPHFAVLGRLRKGIRPEQARRELSAIAAQAALSDRDELQAQVASLFEELRGDFGPTLWALLGAVAFVLLIACSNVASLRLSQVSYRAKQTAVAAALGASRARLAVRPLLESFFLALAGCLLSAVFLAATIQVFGALVPAGLQSASVLRMDWKVLVFALALLLLITLSIGAAPSLQASRQDLTRLLRSDSRMAGPRGRLPKLLAVAEVGLALILLVAAALMIRSLILFTAMEPGFQPQGAITLKIAPPGWKYADPESRSALYEALVEAFRATPGVAAAGAVNLFPVAGGRFPTVVEADAGKDPEPALTSAEWLSVTPGYFAAMGVPVELGRDFNEADFRSGEPPAIVDRSLAQTLWPGRSPLGQRLSLLGSAYRVVGVSGSIVFRGLGKNTAAHVYVPQRTSPLPWPFMTFVIRTDGPVPTLVEAIRPTVASVDADLAVDDLRTLPDLVGESFSTSRFVARLLTAFAVFGLFLASIGIYGVLTSFVSRSATEIGVRMALGATRADTMRLILGRSLRLTLIGLVLGGAGAALVGRLIDALLFGVEPLDGAAYAIAVAVLLATATLASWIPARRAMAIDPSTVLRST